MANMIKIFGAVPVNVTWAEVYTALQRKMIDGFMTATAGAYPAKLYEPVKWVTINDYSVGLHWLSVNKEAFNALPKDVPNQDDLQKIGIPGPIPDSRLLSLCRHGRWARSTARHR